MGHSLPMHLTLVPINVRFTPNSRHSVRLFDHLVGTLPTIGLVPSFAFISLTGFTNW